MLKLLPTTIVAYGISLVAFLVMGFKYANGSSDVTAILAIREVLSANFAISPLLLLPPLAVILAMAFKMPAIPGITIGILIVAIEGVIFQGADLGALLSAAYDGFTSETGIAMLKPLIV